MIDLLKDELERITARESVNAGRRDNAEFDAAMQGIPASMQGPELAEDTEAYDPEGAE